MGLNYQVEPPDLAAGEVEATPSLADRARSIWRAFRTSPKISVFLARRIVDGALVVLTVLSIVFFLTNAIGDPAVLMLPGEVSDAQIEALREEMGLNRPLIVRYLDSLGDWLRGDFGDSLYRGIPALPLALGGMVKTAYLALFTASLAIPLALALGLLAGMRRRSIAGRVVTALAAIGVSTPTFWIGLLAILVFAVELNILPTSGYGSLRYAILPALALAFKPLGRLAQLTQTAVASEANALYVTAARSRGVSELDVTRKHVLPNAAIPVLTLLGDEVATLLNGAVVIEMIFGWPGVGNTLIQAIERRDLPLIVACVAVVAVVVITVNLIVDLAYVAVDPRVRRDLD